MPKKELIAKAIAELEKEIEQDKEDIKRIREKVQIAALKREDKVVLEIRASFYCTFGKYIERLSYREEIMKKEKRLKKLKEYYDKGNFEVWP